MQNSKDNIKIIGIARLTAHRKDGTLAFDTGEIRNQITEEGIAELVALAGNVGSPSAFGYLALGSGSTAPTAEDTGLETEITDTGLERVEATVSQEEENFGDDTLQLFHEWTATGSKTIEEIGIFNAASEGVMLGRLLTGPRNVEDEMKVRATYKVIFAIAS